MLARLEERLTRALMVGMEPQEVVHEARMLA
jgi:hypothetical protein